MCERECQRGEQDKRQRIMSCGKRNKKRYGDCVCVRACVCVCVCERKRDCVCVCERKSRKKKEQKIKHRNVENRVQHINAGIHKQKLSIFY